MTYSHTVEKSAEFASRAFERIQKEGLLPTPENYELWYVFYSGENPEVMHAIELLENGKQKITNERCHEIHHKFLSENTENERVKEAGDKIQNTIKDVNVIVADVKSATEKYNMTLTDVSGKLKSENLTKEEMAAALENVMSNTEQMMSQNQLLEQKLSQSSSAMQQLQRDLEKVRKEALTDGLTNLANRKAFDSEIRRIAEEAKASGTAFSLVLLDIDHFKSFNDNFGHQVGDQVLRLVAKTLTDGVKGRDVAARFGGEEFAIILPETNLQGGVKVGDYLRKAVAGKEVINRNSGETLGRITMSGGVAEFIANEGIDSLIERADAALYTAKHNGRNQISAAPAPGQRKVSA